MISLKDIEDAVRMVSRTTPPDAAVEINDYHSEKLERLLDECINKNIHLDHPAVVEREKEIALADSRRQLHDHLCRASIVRNIKDLREVIDGLPDNMPLICTGETGNRRGLVFYSNEFSFEESPGGKNNHGNAVYSARIYGIPEVNWNDEKLRQMEETGGIW